MLTTNLKLKKMNDKYIGMGLSLSPHYTSGKNVCASSTPECRKYCINWSGNGFYGSVQTARLKKTKLFHQNRTLFLRGLHGSIEQNIGRATRQGKQLAVRLNVFSDIMWEKIDKSLFDYPIQFYDYTKHVKRYQRWLDGNLPDNYHLCFSRSERNDKESEQFLALGGQVNYVFHDIPTYHLGYKVIDGDEHDFRWLDGPGIIGVKSKGRLRGKTSNFVSLESLK